MKSSLFTLMAVAVMLPPGLEPAHAQSTDSATDVGVPYAIPPELADRAGIPAELQQRVLELTAHANQELEALRQKHRNAQQALERLLRADEPPHDVVMRQIEQVGMAETEIRKNRVGLMLQIRSVLGPELWSSLTMELAIERRLAQRRTAQETPPRVGEPVRYVPVSGTLRTSPR